MDRDKIKGVIEAILFASGRIVKVGELISILEINSDEITDIIEEMKSDYEKADRGIELVRVEDGFQLASKKDYYEYLYPALDKRIRPKLSQASLEVLAIIAYNPRITRVEIESIRGVDSTVSLYKLQEFNLIEKAGKSDMPGKPMTYKTTDEFLKMFDIKSLKELPELPRFKLDSNKQIVIDELEADELTKEVLDDENVENDNNESIMDMNQDKIDTLVNEEVKLEEVEEGKKDE